MNKARKSGKTLAMAQEMKVSLEGGGTVGVVGCKDPQLIFNMLKELRVDVKAKPMIATQPMKAVYDLNSIEGEIVGFEDGEKKQTGYVFYIDKDGI